MSLAQGNNTPTWPRIEPGSPDPESDALTTRPVRPLWLLMLIFVFLAYENYVFSHGMAHLNAYSCLLYVD